MRFSRNPSALVPGRPVPAVARSCTLSLNAASTAAPRCPPTLRDIVELELLLQRLFELEETDEDGVVILSDEDQLHRMLFSLRVPMRRWPTSRGRQAGLMTDDVNVLTNIVLNWARRGNTQPHAPLLS